MTLHLVLPHDHAFSPEEIAIMTAAHLAALRKIGLVSREDPATLAIAKAIVELAKQGERDPDRLCERALKFWSP